MMYWSDWGTLARIERASIDGSNIQVIHNTNLVCPNALTKDYVSQTLYWADANLGKIERSRVDGRNRILLTCTGIGHIGMVLIACFKFGLPFVFLILLEEESGC